MLDHRLQRKSQAEAIQLVRPQIVRHLPHFLDGVRGAFFDFLKLFANGCRIVFAPGHHGAVFDDEEILSESVVNLAGESFAFLFLGENEALGKVALRLPFLFEPGHAPMVSRQHQRQERQRDRGLEESSRRTRTLTNSSAMD